jgi:uncharacterized protein YhfF
MNPAAVAYWQEYLASLTEKPKPVVRRPCKTIRVQIAKFKDVGEDVVRAEGEGGLSLEYWRKTHVEFWRHSWRSGAYPTYGMRKS